MMHGFLGRGRAFSASSLGGIWLLSLLVAYPPLHGPPPVAAGSVHGAVTQVVIRSAAVHGARKALVYLPPGYTLPANARRRYPVLILLSGAPGSQKDWFRHGQAAATADRLIARGSMPPVIMISPDGNGGAYRDSQFIDSYDGRDRVATFISSDLLAFIDSRYRAIPSAAARALIGYSAGAYGALNIGLQHPGRFATLVGFCGYYTANPREVTRPLLNHPFGPGSGLLAPNNPSLTALRVRPTSRPRLFLFETTYDA
jgi:enterochelin esterase-like enzyme